MPLASQILNVQQLHRICTIYWDDNYNTRSVSPEVSQFSLSSTCPHHLAGILISLNLFFTSITGYSQYEGAYDRGVEHFRWQFIPAG